MRNYVSLDSERFQQEHYRFFIGRFMSPNERDEEGDAPEESAAALSGEASTGDDAVEQGDEETLPLPSGVTSCS